MMLTVLINFLNRNSLNSADLKARPWSKVKCVTMYALQITDRVHNFYSKYLSKLEEHSEFLISPRMVLVNHSKFLTSVSFPKEFSVYLTGKCQICFSFPLCFLSPLSESI